MSVAINGAERPVSSVLFFMVDDELNFYFTTHRDSVKARSLQVNNKISLSVWSPKRMLVQASGTAHEILDKAEAEKIIDGLASVTTTLDFWPPILQVTGDGYAAYSIKLDWLRVMELSNQKIHPTSTFTQLI